jgi:hypothetical protein
MQQLLKSVDWLLMDVMLALCKSNVHVKILLLLK